MKFYTIPPIQNLNLSKYKSDRVYCLAHLCLPEVNKDWKKYRKFFKKAKKDGYWVTLDNGAAEHSLVTEDILIDLVKDLMPNEVIAPDVLYDTVQTIQKTSSFLKEMISNGLLGEVEVFAVPQGSNPKEYLYCYIRMLETPEIKTIGISKLSVPKCFKEITDSNSVSVNRRYLIKLLNELNLIKKPLHLLGMRNITEYKIYKGIKNIRSSDSCYTILSAIKGIKLTDEIRDDINETPEEYFYKKLTKKEIKLAKENIETLRKINQ